MNTPSSRVDHWIITQVLSSEGAVVRERSQTACGIQLHSNNTSLAEGYYIPNKYIDCPDCLASELYHETLTTLEIGFDGNREAWWQARKATLPRLET